ncbi:gluconolactonase [Pollutimonas bauzanensis]|uniref:Gluconolactonase n=2 Tax=Pollutimonas bauzanensis TaxID=658167 RepID=A0A1M5QKM6_9BURK|nr:gluconolactonase [Pollutimonas bauzanensis]
MISQGHGLLEAPVFDQDHGLLYTDAEIGGVWQFDALRTPKLLVPHRRGIGGMAIHASGGVIVSGRNVAYKRFIDEAPDEPTIVLLENDPANGHQGYNDLVTDHCGRLYVGSLAFVPMLGQLESTEAGSLYLIDLNGEIKEVAQGIRLSNGLGFSPDGTQLYHSDSIAHSVYVYDVAPDGALAGRRNFVTPAEGMPDGLAVAQDGSVWVALVHAGLVVAYDARGKEICRIRLSTPMVTSVCFGDADYKSLYIVSGAQGAPEALGGCIYRIRTNVPGLARPLARVALQSVPHK